MDRLELAHYIAKLRQEGTTFKEISKKIKETFGETISKENVRSTLAYYTDNELLSDDVKDLQAKRRGTLKTRETNIKLRGALDALNQQEDLLEGFARLLPKANFKIHKKVKTKSKKKTTRAIVMHLSDTHFQAQIDKEEMGGLNSYTNVEEARRLAFFCKEVAEFKVEHRGETELVLVINGDTLQGIIHDVESTPAMTTQVCAGIHLLSQAISYLAGEFKKVRVVCTVGNHERMMHKSNKGRQTREKWDSFGTIMNVSLKYIFATYTNVEFIIPTTPYAYIDVLGHKYFICHSDTVLSVGYPGKSINVERAKNKINDLKEGIGHIDVVMIGHVHVDTKQILGNGVTLLTNGSMSGIDEFALSIGITNNEPTQQMHEVTPEHKVGDLRSIYLKQADKKKELDQIVEPFKGKF